MLEPDRSEPYPIGSTCSHFQSRVVDETGRDVVLYAGEECEADPTEHVVVASDADDPLDEVRRVGGHDADRLADPDVPLDALLLEAETVRC